MEKMILNATIKFLFFFLLMFPTRSMGMVEYIKKSVSDWQAKIFKPAEKKTEASGSLQAKKPLSEVPGEKKSEQGQKQQETTKLKSVEVATTLPEKQEAAKSKNLFQSVFQKAQKYVGFGSQTSPEKKMITSAQLQKTLVQTPRTSEHIAAIESTKVFTAEQKEELTQVQKAWTVLCDDLEKSMPKIAPDRFGNVELSEDVKEARQMLDDLKKSFQNQTDEDRKTTITKLNSLLQAQTYDKKSQEALSAVQDDSKKLLAKTKDMLAEMQKLIKEGELSKPEAPPKPGGVRAFKPDAKRQEKIAQGTNLVATLTKNPERIADHLPPKPREIEELLDPSKKITTKQLYEFQHNPAVQGYLEAYRTNIEAIGEHFFNEAKKKAPDYSSGSIVIEDKNGKIHEFLRMYVEICRKLKNGPTTNVDKPCFIANTPAYARLSSHFGSFFKFGSPEAVKAGQPPQYGIDLKNPIETFTENVGSEDVRKQLLFGKLSADEPFIFMKFESEGLGSPEAAAMHFENLLKSIIRKSVEGLEAKLKPESKEDSSETFKLISHREDPPKIILKEYEELLQKTGISAEEKERLLKEVKGRGIAAILRQTNDKPEFKSFADKIRKSYSGDNLDIRVGNEVIIREQELQSLVA